MGSADTNRPTIAFVWENFGPMHDDRCVAVAERLAGRARVVGLEMYARSSTYAWDRPPPANFIKRTLFSDDGRRLPVLRRAWALVRAVRASRARWVFFCHYDWPEITIAATLLRVSGRATFVMSCSKHDDKPRRARTEALKSLALLPYHGAMSSGVRPRDYMRFLGIPRDRIEGEYNTLSVARMRAQAGVPPAPGGAPFATRSFLAVARFVPKKNLSMLLDAYALYRAQATSPRPLVLCGSGPLEAELRTRAATLGIASSVTFTGFVQTDAVSGYLADALALLLPSVEEQFGNVVIEAQALGLPVILSDNCGARDLLVRSGVNGFVIEPDNPTGLAFFMGLLDTDEALWRRMAISAAESAQGGDVARFAEGVERLCEGLDPASVTG